MNKKYIGYAVLPVLALSLLVGGTVFASSKSSSDSNKKGEPFNDLASAIATKFNLSTSDVQSLIKETMDAKKAEMEKNKPTEKAEKTDFLTQAVTDGKITQAQADLIKAKREEVKTAREAEMKAETASLKEWATTNNIPEEYVAGPEGGHRGDFHGGPDFGGPHDDATSTSDN